MLDPPFQMLQHMQVPWHFVYRNLNSVNTKYNVEDRLHHRLNSFLLTCKTKMLFMEVVFIWRQNEKVR